MGSTPQLASAPDKPVRTLGAIAFVLGIAHSWLAAMHWSHHTVISGAFGFAAIGILIPFLIAYAIAGRRTVRDWNRVGLWFLLWAIVIQMALVHGTSMVGVLPR
jgi:hypothetical protein